MDTVNTSQTSSFPFPLTDPIVFENYYRAQMSADSNGQAHFAGGGDDAAMRSDTRNQEEAALLLYDLPGSRGQHVNTARLLWQ